MPRTLALLSLLTLIGVSGGATGFDLTPQDFTRLGTRPLGMGGAWVATGGDEQALFHNPAALAFEKLPRLGSSHSARHFPGPVERDQLDADPTALCWPLTPFLTVGNGWVTQGELGYAHHNLTDPEFPKRHLWGKERVEGLALDLLVLQLGASHRTQTYRYWADDEPRGDQPALDDPTVLVEGEGTTTGFITTVLPGVRYGSAREKLDQDVMPVSLGVTRTTTSTGWSIRPAAWLTLASQTDARQTKQLLGRERMTLPSEPVHRRGMEIQLGPLGALRCGAITIGGVTHPTWGASLHLLGIRLHWAQADDLLPGLFPSGNQSWPERFADTHHYSWSLGL